MLSEKKTATRSDLSLLHSLVCKHLVKMFETGEAETKDVAAATKFLKDNGIEAAFETNDAALEEVAGALVDYAAENGISIN